MPYVNNVVLQSLMLHTKFQGNWPSDFGEEDFLRFWAFLSHLLIARCDIGVQLSVRSFVCSFSRSFICSFVRPSTIHVKVLYSGAVIARSMKPCMVITCTLDKLFEPAPWPGALDLHYMLQWLRQNFASSLENLRLEIKLISQQQ